MHISPMAVARLLKRVKRQSKPSGTGDQLQALREKLEWIARAIYLLANFSNLAALKCIRSRCRLKRVESAISCLILIA